MEADVEQPSTPPSTDDDSRESSKRGKPFEPGNTFGKGRPQGSKNKKTLLLQEMLLDAGEEIVTSVVDRAVAGDPVALAVCIERLIPALKQVRELPIEESTEVYTPLTVKYRDVDGTELRFGPAGNLVRVENSADPVLEEVQGERER